MRATSRTTTRSSRRSRRCSQFANFADSQRPDKLSTISVLASWASGVGSSARLLPPHRLPFNARYRCSRRGAYASAQSRSRALGARRDPRPQRRVQPGGAGHRQRRLLPRRAPAHLRQDGRAQRAPPGDRLRHAEGGAVARRRARRGRRAGLHRVAGRRRAARDQRRVLRADRQGEGDAAESDLRGQQDPDQRLRGRSGIGPDPRRGRERRSSRSPTTG